MVQQIEDPELERDLARLREKNLVRVASVAINKSTVDKAVALGLISAEDRGDESALREFAEHAAFGYVHDIEARRKHAEEVAAQSGPLEVAIKLTDELLNVLVGERLMAADQTRNPDAIGEAIRSHFSRAYERQFPPREIPVSALGRLEQTTGRGGLVVRYGDTGRSG